MYQLFLNRVSQVRILPGAPTQIHKSALSCALVVRSLVRDVNCGSRLGRALHPRP